MFRLVHMLRDQAKSLTKIFGQSQLLALFFLLSLTIISWLMVLQFTQGDMSIDLVVIVASIGFVQFTRLNGMSMLTDQIVQRVTLVL